MAITAHVKHREPSLGSDSVCLERLKEGEPGDRVQAENGSEGSVMGAVRLDGYLVDDDGRATPRQPHRMWPVARTRDTATATGIRAWGPSLREG